MIIPDFREIKHSNEFYHYGIPRRSGRYPWGSGDRPYQSANLSALSIYKFAKEKEKVITKDIKEVAKTSNCRLYGLENRLKTVDSIQRKINKKKIEEGKSEKESIDSIHDSVRYTTISENKDFVSSYKTFKKNMIDLGYSEIECKNYFDLFNKGIVKHKAVQSKFSTTDGFVFEVQFQTPESQDAKIKKIPLYEERREVGIDAKRANEIENEMEKLAFKVPDPPGIEEIKSYSNSSFKHSQERLVNFKMNEFYHYGIKRRSGRYPWGSGDRPYQSAEGSKKTVSVKKSVGLIGYIKTKKADKVRNENLKKARDVAAEKRKHDEDKARVLREGTATEVLKYQGELTNQELQNAVSRLNLESNLRRLSDNEVTTAVKAIDDVMKTVKTGTEWVKIGTDTYNTIASIYNATSDGRKKPLTLVGRGDGSKKKDK